MDFIKVVLSTLLSVVALFIMAKIMGHKQISQLDFFDYITGITIGSSAAELATDLEAPWKSLTAIVIYGLVSVMLSIITNKFPRSRKFINGAPTILMNDGKIYRKNIKKAKLDLTEFLLLCREQGYFDLSEIQVAIFETNGKLSILPVSDKRPLTPTDMNLKPKKAHIGVELIMDGRIMGENLSRLSRSEEWLLKEVKARGFDNIASVFLGIYRSQDDSLTLYENI